MLSKIFAYSSTFAFLSCVYVVAASLPDFPNYDVGRGPECVHINRALKKLMAKKWICNFDSPS